MGRATVTTSPAGRVYDRVPAGGSIALLTYSPERGAQTLWTRAIDMSGAGLKVSAYRPLKVGSIVYIRFEHLQLLAGWARVRHCRRTGWTYRIGLELRKPLPNRF
jgi:hypothetical protein